VNTDGARDVSLKCPLGRISGGAARGFGEIEKLFKNVEAPVQNGRSH